MKDLVSVIIPVYNREAYVGECVQSILAQSYSDFEVILIDDGSTDNTVKICRELAQEEPRIKLLVAEHRGVSAARNVGLDEAQGEYVFFIDSDDAIHPFLLETLVGGMREKNAGISGSRIANVPEAYWYKVKERIDERSGSASVSYQNHKETLHAIFCTESPLSEIGGVMFRRDLIGETRFKTDLYIGEDFYFIYQNLIKGADSVFLDKKWYYCRIHQNNSSWDFKFSGFHNRFYRRQLVWQSEESFGRTEYANRQKQQAFGMFVACVRKNKPYSVENQEMRRFIKCYKKTLFPSMTYKEKIRYYLYVFFPFTSKFV